MDGIGCPHLQLVAADSLPTVLADSKRLGQVLCNFLRCANGMHCFVARRAPPSLLLTSISRCLSNAIKFTPERGHIALSAIIDSHTNDTVTVTFSVVDTGAGISRADQEKLFLPFSQVGDGSRKAHSSGLGLSIAKAIVEEHGGTVGVQSAPDIGSCFVRFDACGVLVWAACMVLTCVCFVAGVAVLHGAPDAVFTAGIHVVKLSRGIHPHGRVAAHLSRRVLVDVRAVRRCAARYVAEGPAEQ